MQITIYLDNMPSLLSIQLYHLLVILAHILLTLGQFIPHPQTPVEVCQKLPTLTIIGVAHQYLVKYQTPMLFLPWIFIITVGSTIPRLHFLQPTIILVALTRVQFHLLLKDLLGRVQIYQDQDLLCTHSLLVTGMPWQNLKVLFRLFSSLIYCKGSNINCLLECFRGITHAMCVKITKRKWAMWDESGLVGCGLIYTISILGFKIYY